MSIVGLAASPGTAVLPTCSISCASSAKASRNARASDSNRSAHSARCWTSNESTVSRYWMTMSVRCVFYSANMSTETLSFEELEQELASLASHLYAGMCRWLELVAELERR